MGRMRVLVSITSAALLLTGPSCDQRGQRRSGPKYGKNDVEVFLPNSILGSTNCFVRGFGVPWYQDSRAASIILTASQQQRETIVRLRSRGVTHDVIRFGYAVDEILEGDFSESVLSFLTFETLQDGVFYRALVLPKQCKFFLVDGEEQFRIVSIELKETPG